MIEIIKHAAVKAKDGQIFLGKSHADCFHQAAILSYPMSQAAEDQGFMTSVGRFVDRKRAAEIAIKQNQINIRDAKILFSEDLWSPTIGGKYDYNYVTGYTLKEKI